MEKLHVKIFSLILMFAAVQGVTTVVEAQTSSGVTVSVARGPHPAWEGKATGDVQSFERNNDDLKLALRSQPVPDISLEFAESRREGHPPSPAKDDVIIKVALPPEAKSILKLFWDEALEFDYNKAFVKAQSAQDASERDIAWINKCEASIVKLEQVEIDAPDGKRKISDLEAEDLVYFARRTSASLVNEAKEIVKNGKSARISQAAQESKPLPSPPESQKNEAAIDRVYSVREVDVKAKIKPAPNDVPQPGRDCDDFDYRLRAVLRVTLHKSGMVTEVRLVKGSGCSFDKEAIAVARRIKFEPARKDGQPVSQYLQVEYEFQR